MHIVTIVLKYEGRSSVASYNLVLNEAPNNNDVTSIANIVLNEAPNSNDATCIGNNVA